MKSNLLSKVIVAFYVIESVLYFFGTAEGYSLINYGDFSNLTRLPRQAKNCNGFKCQTTDECIDEDNRCDGIVDCKDGSDEFEDCKALHCPIYLFKCDYGGCIDYYKKCNGIKECRDNSDEANCGIEQSA